jgi:hypothetical protein
MKKIMVALLMAALFAGSVFAADGFSLTVDVNGNLFTTTAGNGTTETGFFKSLDGGSNDSDLEFAYTDPDGAYGATLHYEVGQAGDNKNAGSFGVYNTKANAWVKFGNIVKLSAGRGIDYRAIEKVGGDKDFGAIGLKNFGAVFAGGKTANPDFSTTDAFKFGSGLVANIFAGPVNIGLFAGPSTGVSAWDESTNLPWYDAETDVMWNGSAKLKNVLNLFNYEYGLSLLYESDVADVGAALKLSRVDAESTGVTEVTTPETGTIIGYLPDGTPVYSPSGFTPSSTSDFPTKGSWGTIATNFGVYGKVKAIDALVIGVGYAGYKEYADADKDPGKYNSPFVSGVNLDLKYTGIDKLTLGLYNNASFYSLSEEKESGLVVQQQRSFFFLFDELNVGYALTEKLSIDARVRNYLATTTFKTGSDDKEGNVGVDQLAIRAGVVYKVKPNAQVWARAQFTNYAHSTSFDDAHGKKAWLNVDADKSSRDHIKFDIPVGIQVKF